VEEPLLLPRGDEALLLLRGEEEVRALVLDARGGARPATPRGRQEAG